MEQLTKLWAYLSSFYHWEASTPLDVMDLGPTENTENPVMVSFPWRPDPLNEIPTLSTDPILYLGLQTPQAELVEVL